MTNMVLYKKICGLFFIFYIRGKTMVQYCPKCFEYYGAGIFKSCEKCLYCDGELTELNIEKDEFNILYKISSDNSFLEAMIDLKEKDPIEFQLKMSQFKTQLQQQERDCKEFCVN
ncbi:MAG: hypothetical protein ACI4SA_07115 [Lachnospiraceae bacterium]